MSGFAPSGYTSIGGGAASNTPVLKYITSADATGGATIWDPTSGSKWVITDLTVSTTAALTLTFADGASGTVLKVDLPALGGGIWRFSTPILSAVANNNFTVTASGAGNIYVTAQGYEVV